MPSSIDRTAVAHVAQLASLSLSDAEAEHLTKDLAAILRYVDELSALDTSSVPATAQVNAGAPLVARRSDDVLPGLTHAEALSQAPRSADGGFAVPAFVESDG
jgi:aspartyl-tRNA(Asn)/glutamyl-tRNA(Gln) amidotransferase subunit C